MENTAPNRWPRLLLWGLVLIALIQGLWWYSVLPPTPDVVVPTPGPITIDGERATLPHSSLERREGYWFFVHRGDPVALGAEHAALGGFLIQRVEDEMFAQFSRTLPLPLRLLLPPFLLWSYRHMAHHLPAEQLEELWGFSQTYTDRHAFPLGTYQRGLYYHALHDITQELVGNPWVEPAVAGACTAFAASGRATENGHLLLGRNFDFEVFPLFDREKVVHLYAREGAIPVLSVSWMAMAGVVTGMNAEGIWLSVNAARSVGHNRKGPSVALWIRSILEQAKSIDDVERLFREKEPLVTNIYLVGDGKTGEAAVIERGPGRIGRRDSANDRITAANHLLTAPFADDPRDAALRRYSTTVARGLRMDELVNAAPLSLERGLDILRDRNGPQGLSIGPGNRNAIDALIATHSVLADATDRVLWVSTAPHTQGSYRAIDFLAELEAAGIDATDYRASLPPAARNWEEEEEPPAETTPAEVETTPAEAQITPAEAQIDLPGRPPDDFPPSPFLNDGGYEQLVRYRAYLLDARAYLDHGDLPQALNIIQRAQELQPESAEAYRIEGEVHAEAGHMEEARAAFVRYFEHNPAFGPGASRSLKWLEDHGGPIALTRPDAP